MNKGALALLMLGCDTPSTMQSNCQRNDAGVSPQNCYNAALEEGVVDGRQAGELDGYNQGVAECNAAYAAAADTADTADTGDTGSSVNRW